MSRAIDIKNLTVTYGEKKHSFTALQDISLTIAAGEFVSIIGSSGCGKSTLLGVLEGLIRPSSGTASVGGHTIHGPSPERSVVFQQYSLFPWMTALGNVAFALKQARPTLKKRDRLELGKHYLRQVGLAGFEDRFPKAMSGGQQQRVAIARALAENGEVLLMDEPFGAIDAKNRAILQDLLLELWEGEASEPEGRKTVVFITHDLDEAILLSDRIILLEADHTAGVPGHVRQEFTVPLPRPRQRLSLLKSREYSEFRARVSEVFFEDEERQVYAA